MIRVPQWGKESGGPRIAWTQRAGVRIEQGTGPRLRVCAGARGRARDARRARRRGAGEDGRRNPRRDRCDGASPWRPTSSRLKAALPRLQPARSRTFWSTTPAARRPATFRTWSRDDWLAALDANMLAPIELIKATVDGMIARKFGRIVNITSGAVKAPIDVLGLSNGARSGPHRLRRRIGAQDRGAQRHHQQPAARFLRHRPHRHGDRVLRPRRAACPTNRSWSSGWRPYRPAASAILRNSVPPAPGCVRRRPASSPGRTGCSTAAPTPEPSDALWGRLQSAKDETNRIDRHGVELCPAC
jgi:hypothetical protein